MVNPQSRNSIIDMKTGFYNRRFFNLRLREEGQRIERSGSPFSLLTLNIADLADAIKKRPKLKIHQMKKIITNTVRENTRDIDIKSWHDDTTLKILMPETPNIGANFLAEKLQVKVNEALGTFFGLKSAFDLKKNMTIKSYPEATKNQCQFPESGPSVKKKPMADSPVSWANRKINRPKKVRG
ncbi:MAG: diguanylate cyclase [Candidatus Aenigmarchaeota archaeon]|nr:diguanylate cyclase [Candidatus Aenigmarchaeota archaeon]